MDDRNIVEQAIRYVQEHLADDRLTTQHVAGAMGYSADYLSRLFTARTGYTLAAYIVRCRLSRSAELLSMTAKSVLDIALEVGFASHEGFIRAFKKQYRITPSMYRYLHRESRNYAKQRKGERNRMSKHLEIPFVDDEEVVGKWERVAVLELQKSFDPSVEEKETDLGYAEIYFLPQGEGYWIFEGWTKGNLFIHYGGDEPVQCFSYRIKVLNGQTYLFLDIDEEGVSYIEVLKQVNCRQYSRQEIGRHDNTNLAFVPDDKAVGVWQSVAFVGTPEEFAGVKAEHPLWLRSVKFSADGVAVRNYDGEEWQERWTKGALIDEYRGTVSRYFFAERNGEEYLFMEWKTGNYVYGGMEPTYYVFKRA